jgi:hypothetical protein
MFPSLVDSGFHIVSQDDEFRRPAVVMGAKAHDVDFGYSGAQNSRESKEAQGRAISYGEFDFPRS